MRSSPVVLKKFEGKMDSEGNRLTYRMKQTAAKVVPRVENSENCARSGPLVHLSAKPFHEDLSFPSLCSYVGQEIKRVKADFD